MSIKRAYYRFLRSVERAFPFFYGHAFTHRRKIKYVIAGGTAAVVDVGFLYVFTDVLDIWYITSAIIAFVFAFCISFTLQKFWTFRDDRTTDMHIQVGKYFLVALVNLALNTALMYVLVDRFGIWYILSQIIIGLSIAVGSYFVYKKIIFRA
ncbi:MAG TPA: GtrA family protein [Candidatus Paceibacterota bacterium]